MSRYNHREAEPKWRAAWARANTFRAPDPSAKPQGLAERSTDPNGVEGERVPTRDVGEYWPFVSP